MSNEVFPVLRSAVSISPPEEWVLSRQVDLEFRAPSGAPESVLLVDFQFHASRGAAYRRLVRRFETPSAVQQGAQWSCDFDPLTQRVVIHSIAICRGGESKEQAVDARLRVIQREENLERLIVDGGATIILLLEDVQIGDVVDVSYTTTTRPKILPDHFTTRMLIPNWSHGRAFHARILFPRGVEMQWKSDAKEMQLQTSELPDGEQEWNWELASLKPSELEPGTPSWVFPAPYLQLSTVPNWSVVAEAYDRAWRWDFDHPELRKALELIRQEPTLTARMEKALRWVQDDLRYLSVDTELGRQTPTSAGDVLQRRFGDCKDKTFLLAHLLRLLGVSARPVLVSSQLRNRVREFLPASNIFDHVIVEFEHGGNRRWVDATIAFQGGGPFGRPVPEYGFGLPIGPGVTDLEPIESPREVQHRYECREYFRLESGTNLTLTAVIRAAGRFADELRYQHRFGSPQDAAKARAEFYGRYFPSSARATEPEVRDDRERNEFALVESFRIPRALVRVDGDVLGLRFIAHVPQQFLGCPDTPRRKHPFGLREPCMVEHRVQFDFPTFIPPGAKAGTVTTPHFSLDLKIQQAADRSVLTHSVRVKAQEVPAETFGSYRAHVLAALKFSDLVINIPKDARSLSPNRGPAAFFPRPLGSSLVADGGPKNELQTVECELAPALLSRSAAAPSSERAIKPTQPVGRPASSLGTESQVANEDSQTVRSKRRRRGRKRRDGLWRSPAFWIVVVFAVVIVLILLAQYLNGFGPAR